MMNYFLLLREVIFNDVFSIISLNYKSAIELPQNFKKPFVINKT